MSKKLIRITRVETTEGAAAANAYMYIIYGYINIFNILRNIR